MEFNLDRFTPEAKAERDGFYHGTLGCKEESAIYQTVIFSSDGYTEATGYMTYKEHFPEEKSCSGDSFEFHKQLIKNAIVSKMTDGGADGFHDR